MKIDVFEQWKPVPGFEEEYQVSNYGRVKNAKTGHIKTERIKKSGHIEYLLRKQGKTFSKRAHRLVAMVFIPNPQNKPEVHHIDKNPTNNCVENLMWVTRKEHHALHPERHKNAKDKCSSIVLQYTLDDIFVREWSSTREIQKGLGYWNASIARACRTHKPYKGFIWAYKNEGQFTLPPNDSVR